MAISSTAANARRRSSPSKIGRRDDLVAAGATARSRLPKLRKERAHLGFDGTILRAAAGTSKASARLGRRKRRWIADVRDLAEAAGHGRHLPRRKCADRLSIQLQ